MDACYPRRIQERTTAMEAMTAVQATTFENGRSLTSEVALAVAAQEHGCQCEAYVDWFTYKRWQAQGMQVRKGEHGVHLTTWIHYTTTDSKGNEVERVRPKSTTVFCRCQVKAAGA